MLPGNRFHFLFSLPRFPRKFHAIKQGKECRWPHASIREKGCVSAFGKNREDVIVLVSHYCPDPSLDFHKLMVDGRKTPCPFFSTEKFTQHQMPSPEQALSKRKVH